MILWGEWTHFSQTTTSHAHIMFESVTSEILQDNLNLDEFIERNPTFFASLASQQPNLFLQILHLDILHDNTDRMSMMIQSPVNMSTFFLQDYSGDCGGDYANSSFLLHAAARKGSPGCLELLLESKAPVNAIMNSETALHYCSKVFGDNGLVQECMRLLCEAGANVNAQTNLGRRSCVARITLISFITILRPHRRCVRVSSQLPRGPENSVGLQMRCEHCGFRSHLSLYESCVSKQSWNTRNVNWGQS